MKNVTKVAILLTPLLIFAILLVPYNLINQRFIVDWLGCGCPQIDESGNLIENNFNANDFTRLFWSVITIIAAVISVFLSKRIPKEMFWLRILYVTAVIAVSLCISSMFYQSMMWC
jgi:hypothetical protein